MIQQLINLWLWLTEPSPVIEDPDQRYQSRLISILFLVLSLAFLLGSVSTVGMVQVSLGVTSAFCLVSYGIGRTRYYAYGGTLGLCIIAVAELAAIYFGVDNDSGANLIAFIWLALPVLLAGSWLSLGSVILIASTVLVGVMVLLLLVPEFDWENGIQLLSFFLFLSSLVIIETRSRLKNRQQIREQAEKLRQAKLVAEEANQFKSKIVSMIGHDLRTPLSAILGYSEMLQEGDYGPITTEQQSATSAIIESTYSLNQFIDSLLEQVKQESTQLILDNHTFSPDELVAPVMGQMRVLANKKNLQLTLDIAANMPLLLRGDIQRLQQVLYNLVGNAIKFTERGSVSIRLRPTTETSWSMAVEDTGIGISAEDQALIFEPYRQVNGAKADGFGLGLSIVRQLIEQMQGQIEVNSQLGQGTTFTVQFPLHTATEVSHESEWITLSFDN